QNVEVDIYGSDFTALGAIARDVLNQVRGISGMENADTNVQESTPELRFRIDRDKAQQFGVSFTDIANAINTATNGNLAGFYQEAGFQYPIYVELPEPRRISVNAIM